MQRVKAHELRQKDEKALVDELTKFRVPLISNCLFITERISPIESQQGFRSSTS